MSKAFPIVKPVPILTLEGRVSVSSELSASHQIQANERSNNTGNNAFNLNDGEWQVVACITIIVMAIMTTYPLLTSNWLKMHDIAFHAARIRSIAQGMQSGVFPVKLYSSQAYDFGYPCGVCYPDLFLYIPAVFVCLGMRLRASYVAFVFLINLSTAAISWFSFRRIGRSRYAGLIGCILWTLAPYRIVNVLLRAAVGESLALVFGPLVLLGLWKAFLDDTSASGSGWLEIGIGMAGIVHSHVLSVLIYFVWGIPLLIILMLWRNKRGAWKSVCKGALLCALLSAGFMIPFLDYYFGHDLRVKHALSEAYNHATELAQLLAPFFECSGLSQPLGESLSEEMPLTIGWSLISMLPLGIGMIVLPSFCVGNIKKMRRWTLALCILSLAIMLLTTHYFPWKCDGLPTVIRSVVKRLCVIQFPWRFLGPISLILALLGVLIAANGDRRIRLILLFCIFLSIIECGYTTGSFVRNAIRQNVAFSTSTSPKIGQGEYLPSSLNTLFAKSWNDNGFKPIADTDQLVINDFEHLTPQKSQLSVVNNSEETQHVRLPIFWHEQLVLASENEDGNPTSISMENDGGYAALSVGPGTNGVYIIEFREPIVWRISEAISFLTFVAIIVFGVRWHYADMHMTSDD